MVDLDDRAGDDLDVAQGLAQRHDGVARLDRAGRPDSAGGPVRVVVVAIGEDVAVRRFRPAGWLDWTFEIALILKGIDGVLEIVGGLVLLVVSKETLEGWVQALTFHELSEDPHDFLFTRLVAGSHSLTGSGATFAALYLLTHGVVKVVLVVAVLRDYLWAYPWMIGFLLVFIAYQLYRFALHPTWGMALLTVVDVLIVGLTWREWGRRRDAARGPSPDIGLDAGRGTG